jgi:lysine 6-dehydrogenase
VITFPKPFGAMEAFLTSGGCSWLPYTFQNIIQYLDYKTIRYPGHCEQFKPFLDLGLGSTDPISINGTPIVPRDVFIHLLERMLPYGTDDVVLLKVLSKAKKDDEYFDIEYSLIDYKDKKSSLTAMMRTTAFPVSITASLLQDGVITKSGVFCPEEIIPPLSMFNELKKRKIMINKTETKII